MNKYFILLSFIFFSKKVYSCDIPSADKISNLEALTAILNNLDTNENWSHNLNRNILFDQNKHQDLDTYIDNEENNSDGELEEFNVLSVLQKYDQDEDRDNKVSFEIIRGLIQDATACAGLTNLSLFGFLLLKDLLPFTNSLISKYKQPANNDSDEDDIINLINIINESYDDDENIQRLQQVYDDYRMNFGVSTKNGQIEFKAMGKLLENKLDINSAWKSAIQKSAILDIDYRIHPQALKALFKCRKTAKPVVVDLFELVYMLTFIVKITDEKLEETCVDHENRFVKKYQSLGKELGEEFLQFINDWDEKTLDLTEWGLYKTFFTQFVDKSVEPWNESLGETSKAGGDGKKQAGYPNEPKILVNPLIPFLIIQAKFKDENTAFSWGFKEEYVQNDRYFKNATNRKLSFSAIFESYDEENSVKEESNKNGSDDGNSGEEESSNKSSNDEKTTDVYYRFNGRVNINLS